MNFDGDLIWDTGIEKYGDWDKADEYAEAYGATRTTGRWGKKIGIYDVSLDRTTHYRCPECTYKWPRS